MAQSPSPTPAPSPSPTPITDGINFSDSLQRLTVAAADFVPAFVREVEKPLGGYFELLAWWLAWLTFMVAFLKVLRAASEDPKEILLICARAAVIFALLGYCGDTNHDGIRGDLINNLGSVGYIIAYGQKTDEGATGYLQSIVTKQQTTFSNNYQAFTENCFTVKVNNQDVPVQYPTDGSPYQRLAAIYSSGDSLSAVNSAANPSGWTMASLFQWLNVGRGILEFGDLFLLVLQGFLVATMRLAAPFMIAVAIDREWARKISYNFAWAVVIVTLALPVISQVVRFTGYLAANMAMDAASSQPYYTWDPTTLQIVQQGNPVNIILIATGTMIFFGLFMIGSPWFSYKLASGQVLEAMSGLVTSWFGAGASTGVATYSAAAGAAIGRQAQQLQIEGTSSAEQVTARSALSAGNTEARYKSNAESMRSRSTAQEAAANAAITARAQNERAQATQGRMERSDLAGFDETQAVQAGRVEGAEMQAAPNLAQAPYNTISEIPLVGPIIGGGARTIRDVGATAGMAGNRSGPTTGGVTRGTGAGRPFSGIITDDWGAGRDYRHTGSMQDAHTGVDLGWGRGESVGSAGAGTVIFAGQDGGYGNRVVVDHGNGNVTSYSHLQNISVQQGQQVAHGEQIGRVGETGEAHGPHLHFETGIRRNGTDQHGAPNMAKYNPHLSNFRPVRGGQTPALSYHQYQIPDRSGETLADWTATAPADAAAVEHNVTVAAAAQRTQETIAATREETATTIQANNAEAAGHSQAAWAADAQRQQAIRVDLTGSLTGNQIRYDGAMEAIRIRHEAMSQAAKLSAVQQVVTQFGSTAASQISGVFQQFNRF